VRITYDQQKRELTLTRRGLDFEDAPKIFEGRTFSLVDDRKDYGEKRTATFGKLNDRMVVVVWTQRDDAHHIISMRKCNEREQRKYRARLG